MQIFVDVTDERNKLLLRSIKGQEYFLGAGKEGDTFIFSPAKKWTKEMLENLHNNITLYCGNINEEFAEIIKKKGILYKNFMANPNFITENSKLTSEAVLSLIILGTKKSIYENKILVLGAGNLGMSLMILLSKLGVDFYAANYGEKRFYDAHQITTKCYRGDEFKKHLKEFDVIVNTIPADIFSVSDIKKIAGGTLFLETASKNCLDASNVKHFNYQLCPALPGKFSPESAAKLMMKFIKGEIK